nr:ankyrin repeat domain-containing protein [Dechloromonas sp.]
MKHSAVPLTSSDLRQAVERGDLQALRLALDAGGDIEEADIHGDPGLPLRIACFAGHLDIVHELISRGARIDAPNDLGAGGPMRAALRGGHDAIVKLLAAYGAKTPAGLASEPASSGERRMLGERRLRDIGPPAALRERRVQQERRATSVSEIELSDLQWENYFSQSQPTPMMPEALHEAEHEVSLILGRARD